MHFINICAWKDIPKLANYNTFITYLLGMVHTTYRRHTDISRVNG